MSWQTENVLIGLTDPEETAPEFMRRTDGKSLLYSGRIHSIAGEPESGKSWLAELAATQILSGETKYAEGGTVVWVDFEERDSYQLGERLSHLGVSKDAAKERLAYIRPTSPFEPESDERGFTDRESSRFASLFWQKGIPDLIVIDGVTASLQMWGLDGNSSKDVAKWFHEFPQRIQRATSKYSNGRLYQVFGSTAILMLDHVTKANDGTGRYAIGSVHKLAAIDGAQYLLDVKEPFGRGMVGSAELRVTKDRPGHIRDIGTNFREYDRSMLVGKFVLDNTDRERVAARIEPTEGRAAENRAKQKDTADERILVFLRDNPWSSGKAVRTNTRDHAETVTRLKRLVEEGKIDTKPGPSGSTLYALP
jgi:hypothetical protein